MVRFRCQIVGTQASYEKEFVIRKRERRCQWPRGQQVVVLGMKSLRGSLSECCSPSMGDRGMGRSRRGRQRETALLAEWLCSLRRLKKSYVSDVCVW